MFRNEIFKGTKCSGLKCFMESNFQELNFLKELLLCNAISLQAAPDLSSPQCIEHFLLNVVVLKRWVPAVERVMD